MLKVYYENRFKKDVKRLESRGKKVIKLRIPIELLASGKKLPKHYKDHKLVGNYMGFRECHIEPDWLLIYKLTSTHLYLVRTGTHSDLF